MGFGSFLSNGLTAASNTVGAYQGAEQKASQQKIAQAIQEVQMQRQMREQVLKDALTQAQTARALRQNSVPQLGDPNYDELTVGHEQAMARGGIAPKVEEIEATAQPKANAAAATIQATAAPKARAAGMAANAEVPAKVATAKATADFAAPIATQETAGGPVTYKTRSQALGTMKAPTAASGALAAPMAAKIGQAGEMLKKASDLLPAMDALNVALPSSAAQDIATHGLGFGSMRIPGTQGAGSLMLNKVPEYATYQAAITPFILAAAHALSGARINDEQVKQIRASIEIRPGESPESRAQKKKNVMDLINSINGSLPPDAIGAQEGQMEPVAMERLRSAGYRSSQHVAPAGPSGNVNLGAQKPPLSEVDKAHAARDPQFAAWLKTQGYE